MKSTKSFIVFIFCFGELSLFSPTYAGNLKRLTDEFGPLSRINSQLKKSSFATKLINDDLIASIEAKNKQDEITTEPTHVTEAVKRNHISFESKLTPEVSSAVPLQPSDQFNSKIMDVKTTTEAARPVSETISVQSITQPAELMRTKDVIRTASEANPVQSVPIDMKVADVPGTASPATSIRPSSVQVDTKAVEEFARTARQVNSIQSSFIPMDENATREVSPPLEKSLPLMREELKASAELPQENRTKSPQATEAFSIDLTTGITPKGGIDTCDCKCPNIEVVKSMTQGLTVPQRCANQTYCDQVLNYPEEEVNEVVEKFPLDEPVRRFFGNDNNATDNRQSPQSDPDESDVCPTRSETITPRAIRSLKDGQWKAVINTRQYRQEFVAEICIITGSCPFVPESIPSRCTQHYITVGILVLTRKNRVQEETLRIPAGCVCKYHQN